VSKALGGVAILQKGESDIIAVNTEGAESREAHEASKISPHESEQNEVVVVQTLGGMKRCGGQGDILSGSVGAFLAWAKCYESGAFGDKTIPVSRMPILASVGASMVTRATSRLAFEKEGRAVMTQDMLKEIGGAFAEVFGSAAHQGAGKL
jgi:ATP-dependent NAD(P)H-hydrate dehydratase